MSVEEISFRKKVFSDNLAYIQTLNANPNSTAHFGVNFMSDWTKEEKNVLLGAIPSLYQSGSSRAKVNSEVESI